MEHNQTTYLLPGNEILGCPCAHCAEIHDVYPNEDYPCIKQINQLQYLPLVSSVRYTTYSERLAEGYVDGERYIAFSSKRGLICLVQKPKKWEIVCSQTFWNLDAHYMEVDTSSSPAMCLRALETELSGLDFCRSVAKNIIPSLICDIEELYLQTLKDEIAYLEHKKCNMKLATNVTE